MDNNQIEKSPLPYNSQMERLVIPAYGRTIQNMIDYCVQIPEKEERTVCAYAIAEVMKRMFPDLTNHGDEKKIWDHINIMARFELDIDFPCEVITKEEENMKPGRLPYGIKKTKMRLYGNHVQALIEKLSSMEPSPDRDTQVMMIANHMKKLLVLQNQESVSDERVRRDIIELSEGRIEPDSAFFLLHDYKEVKPAASSKKKKRK